MYHFFIYKDILMKKFYILLSVISTLTGFLGDSLASEKNSTDSRYFTSIGVLKSTTSSYDLGVITAGLTTRMYNVFTGISLSYEDDSSKNQPHSEFESAKTTGINTKLGFTRNKFLSSDEKWQIGYGALARYGHFTDDAEESNGDTNTYGLALLIALRDYVSNRVFLEITAEPVSFKEYSFDEGNSTILEALGFIGFDVSYIF